MASPIANIKLNFILTSPTDDHGLLLTKLPSRGKIFFISKNQNVEKPNFFDTVSTGKLIRSSIF